MKLEIELHIPTQIFDFCEYYEQWISGLGQAVEEDIYAAFYQYFEEKSTVLILDILSQASGKKSRWPA